MSAPNLNGNLLKPALYMGDDTDLFESVRVSVISKYQLESFDVLPHVWPEGVDTVFLEYDGDKEAVLSHVSQLLTLSNGVAIYVLLKQRDVDFIIEANHQGVQGFIEVPDEVYHILSILHMQDRRRKGKNGNVSSFFSLKGGVGCTALATHIAAEMADMTDRRTVLVDLNMPLGDTVLYLNMEGERLYTLTDFVHNLNRFDEKLVYKSLSQHESGLYVLPLPSELNELENFSGDVIKTVIQALRKYFDHVVIDCSSDLSEFNLCSLDESDNIVLVCEPSVSSLRAVNSVVRITQRLGYLKDTLKLIVNRANSQEDEMIEEVIQAMAVNQIVKVNNDYQAFNESLKQGVLVPQLQKSALVNRQMQSIAQMLHNGSSPSQQAATQALDVNKPSLFRRMTKPFSGNRSLKADSAFTLEKSV